MIEIPLCDSFMKSDCIKGFATNQSYIKNDIAYLDDACENLSIKITNNDERYRQQFSESQSTFENRTSKIRNDTTHMKAAILEQRRKIQKLEVEV